MQNSASPEPSTAAASKPTTVFAIRGDTLYKTHPDGRTTTAKISGFGPSVRLDQVKSTFSSLMELPDNPRLANHVQSHSLTLADHERRLGQMQREVSVIHHQRILGLADQLERTNRDLVRLVNDLNERVASWKAKHMVYDQAIGSLGRRLMRLEGELRTVRSKQAESPVAAVAPKVVVGKTKRGRPRKADAVPAVVALTKKTSVPDRSEHWRYPLRRTQRVTEEDAARILAS